MLPTRAKERRAMCNCERSADMFRQTPSWRILPGGKPLTWQPLMGSSLADFSGLPLRNTWILRHGEGAIVQIRLEAIGRTRADLPRPLVRVDTVLGNRRSTAVEPRRCERHTVPPEKKHRNTDECRRGNGGDHPNPTHHCCSPFRRYPTATRL